MLKMNSTGNKLEQRFFVCLFIFNVPSFLPSSQKLSYFVTISAIFIKMCRSIFHFSLKNA